MSGAAARPAFAMLAHERLDRAAALASALAAHGPVAVHLDVTVPDPGPLAGTGAEILQTRRAEWGRFGLVAASLDLVRALLPHDPTHICLVSGACLPIRPLEALSAHLQPGRDYIESVPASRDAWVQDGLSLERFTLHHWFSFRRQRWLFDCSVELQRLVRVRRRLPEGVVPHLGQQWWCLSAETLQALLDDPRLPAWQRFFRRTWIPDEGFFQSLQRTLGAHPPLPPITLARFDPRGRPYIFHDDHGEFLARDAHFFARKIDPDAAGLYRRFLPAPPSGPRAPTCETVFDIARAQERSEGRGQLSPARYPGGTTQAAVQTAAPYLVFVAADPGLLVRLRAHLADAPCRLHGLLFDPARPAAFACGTALSDGNLPATPAIRDYRPAQFLARLIWAGRDARPAFFHVPGPPSAISGQIVGDGNARVVLIGEGARLLAQMTAPLPPKRRWRLRKRAPKPREVWAWTRSLDAGALAADLAAGGGPALAAARAIASAPWSCRDGWTVPPGAKGAG